MRRIGELLIIFNLYLYAADTAKVPCIPQDTCSCVMPNGDEVSLWPIDDPQSPRFTDITDTNSSFIYTYSPCTPFNQTSPIATYNCNNVIVCQRDKYTFYLQYPIATPQGFSTSFVEQTGKNYLTFLYKGGGGRTTRIMLNCSQEAEHPTMTVPREVKSQSGSVYTFMLTSKHACFKKVTNDEGNNKTVTNDDGSDNKKVTYDGSDNKKVTYDGSDNKKVTYDGSDNKKVTYDGSDNKKVTYDGGNICAFSFSDSNNVITMLTMSVILLVILQVISFFVMGVLCYKTLNRAPTNITHKLIEVVTKC